MVVTKVIGLDGNGRVYVKLPPLQHVSIYSQRDHVVQHLHCHSEKDRVL
jgi:hypothetical protein